MVRLELEKFDEYVTVYNLEIDDFHTYFIGDAYDDADASVLVHNTYDKTGNDTPESNPEAFNKQRGNQGYKDKHGNYWKKDKLHKDHWDITNPKGKKEAEIDFDGNLIWPDGPKNKNKR